MIVRRWHRRKATGEVMARTRKFGAAGVLPDDEEIRTVRIGTPKKEWGQCPQVVPATTRHERHRRNLAGEERG